MGAVDTGTTPFPPELDVLRRASQGDDDALRLVLELEEDRVRAVADAGRAAHGDLGLDQQACALALSRIVTAVVGAELAAAHGPVPTLARVFDTLVLPDVYLSEALLRGRPAAWQRFEEVLEQAWATVRARFVGPLPHRVLDELRDSVLGTFFLEGKVRGYRATAPIGAWARQVIFNIFRQHMNRLRAGREAASFSQLGAAEGTEDPDGLLPPARNPAPGDRLARAEWASILEQSVPQALEMLDRDERHMLEVLPTGRRTQVALARELGVSPFRMNRWYKDVRRRFLRELTHRIRLLAGLEPEEAARLVDHLAALWHRPRGPDLPQGR